MKTSRSMTVAAILLGVSVVALTFAVTISYSQQPPTVQQQALVPKEGLLMIGAGLAAGLGLAGAGIGLGTASAAAIGAIAEKPELLGRTLVFIVLIEAIAIYGLAMFFIIYTRIG